MATLTDVQFEAAEARGREMLAAEPRASAAHYDRTSGRVVLDLVNGCSYAFPARLVQDLQGATDDDLVGVQVEGVGYNLHWPALDADLYVPALVAGVFGTKAWIAREMARRAGQVTSPAKATAARENGAKGGRPRKALIAPDVQNTRDQSAPPIAASLSDNSRPNDDPVISTVEERLVVDKREVARGGVRVRSYVIETPINEQVSLREEDVSLERRPMDRADWDGRRLPGPHGRDDRD